MNNFLHKLILTNKPVINFINVLRTAFMLVGPKSVRIMSHSQYLYTLLGSTGAKDACRTLMKLTPAYCYILKQNGQSPGKPILQIHSWPNRKWFLHLPDERKWGGGRDSQPRWQWSCGARPGSGVDRSSTRKYLEGSIQLFYDNCTKKLVSFWKHFFQL